MINVSKTGEHEVKVVFPASTVIDKEEITAEELYHALTDSMVPVAISREGCCGIKI